MIFIQGNTPSSKNSKRIITITNKKNWEENNKVNKFRSYRKIY